MTTPELAVITKALRGNEPLAEVILDALCSAGCEVIALPQATPDPLRNGAPVHYWTDRFGAKTGPVHIVNDGTRVALPGGKHMPPGEARRCAAALIAAANLIDGGPTLYGG